MEDIHIFMYVHAYISFKTVRPFDPLIGMLIKLNGSGVH